MTPELQRSWIARLARAVIGLGIVLMAFALGSVTVSPEVLRLDHSVLAGFISLRTHTLTSIMRTVTTVFEPQLSVVWALILGGVTWAGTRSWRAGLLIPSSMFASDVVTSLMKDYFDRTRPPFPSRLVIEPSWSYPSGHTSATASFVVASVFILIVVLRSAGATGQDADDDEASPLDSVVYVRRRMIAWSGGLALVALVGCSRLYLGAHWLSDVIGGALTGTGVTFVCAAVILPAALRLERLNK